MGRLLFFTKKEIEMTKENQIYRFSPLNFGELQDLFEHITRFYDIANWQGRKIQIRVFFLEEEEENNTPPELSFKGNNHGNGRQEKI